MQRGEPLPSIHHFLPSHLLPHHFLPSHFLPSSGAGLRPCSRASARPGAIAFQTLAAVLLTAALSQGAPRIDNVLIRMVPPGTTSLVGAHMDQLLTSDLYQKLTLQQKLPGLDQFARETGFDPRRDVREILLTTGPIGTVLMARGKFNLKQDPAAGLKLLRHGQYNIQVLDDTNNGFCILDNTLAAAGDIPAVEAALDEWQHGTHKSAEPLLATVASVTTDTPLWGTSSGFATFLAGNLPRAGNGVDFSAIFKGIESTWFSASVNTGFHASIHATTAAEKDAINLRDTAKGLIGLGRLMVPQDKPDLVRFWDGITVEQTGRFFTLNADIGGDMIDQMVQLLSATGGRGGSGRGGRAGSGRRGPAVP